MTAQPLRFLGVGICGYAVNLAAFALLYAAGHPYAAAAVLAYARLERAHVPRQPLLHVRARSRRVLERLRPLPARRLPRGRACRRGAGRRSSKGSASNRGSGSRSALLVVAPLAFALFKRVSFRLS